MSRILAIDTSSDGCSATMLCDGESFSRFEKIPRQHTRLIMPMIDEVVAEAGIAKSQIDAIAFGAGPGSFTGLRIAAGIAQGLAAGLDKPVIPISTLEALAFDPVIRQTGSCIVACAFDARMGEVYWGVYEFIVSAGEAVNEIHRLTADRVIQPGKLSPGFLPTRQNLPVIGIGGGWIYETEIVAATQISPSILFIDEIAKASVIAELAQREFDAGRVFPPEQAIPVYLRDEITWKKLPGR